MLKMLLMFYDAMEIFVSFKMLHVCFVPHGSNHPADGDNMLGRQDELAEEEEKKNTHVRRALYVFICDPLCEISTWGQSPYISRRHRMIAVTHQSRHHDR